MKLDEESLEWAVRSLERHGDTDLFPRPIELGALALDVAATVSQLSAVELPDFRIGASRRFLVPKGELAYRQATQFDPLDSLMLTALIFEFGQGLEDRRRPLEENSVFSYRFAPSAEGELYAAGYGWNAFWEYCLKAAGNCTHVLVADIADFYNQVYHHTYENQLEAAGWPAQARQLVKRAIQSTTAKVSRGIPVGPHWCHLLAEAALIPVDNSLSTRGVRFARYVDDIVVFANSDEEARLALFQVADALDKQERLHLQNTKTRILEVDEFKALCVGMIEDRAINDLEQMMVDVIKKHSGGNPYQVVLLSDLSDEELAAFTSEAVDTVMDEYLCADPPDYSRIRWFLRRMAQVGHPAAVEFCLDEFKALLPAVSEVCRYLVSVSDGGQEVDWLDAGDTLLAALDQPLVRSNEFLQLSLLSLFGRVAALNHVDRLTASYPQSSPAARRELLTAVAAAGGHDWLRELKEQYASMDPWTRRAYLAAIRGLPKEERDFFLRSVDRSSMMDQVMIGYSKAGG